MKFFNFLNYLALFFENFLARVVQEWNSGQNFFSHILSLSQPSLDRNNARMKFLNFLNFFAIVLGILLPGSRRNGISDEIVFFSFSAYLNPIWIENNARMKFFSFFIIFLEFSIPGQVQTEFGTKFFFSLSRPISAQIGQK